MSLGLTLGKYAPLHHGHQLVIERAIAENEHTIVVIYDAPEVTTIPLETRAGWIRRLYPSVEVILAKDGPTIVGEAPEITRLHDAYLRQLLVGRNISHFYSSEFYGHHVSLALGAIDCRVDNARARIPISGTEIRKDPHQFRHYLDSVVYRDLVAKVVFLGAPSTGKTTLASELATRLNTTWMPEFGREYWDTHQVDRRLTLEQLAEIAVGHREREDEIVLDANHYLFVDTNATTTYQFSLDYHGQAHPTVTTLANQCRDRYRLCFLCDTDIPYDDTWDRSGELHREEFQAKILADLVRRDIGFVTLSGTFECRIRNVIEKLNTLDSWTKT